MKKTTTTLSKTRSKAAWITYGVVGILWVGYVVLLFIAKSNDQYHLGFAAINIIRISFALPILLIWLAAALAAVRFYDYARLIKGSPEAIGFKRVANGLYFLLCYLVWLLLMGQIVKLFIGTHGLTYAVFMKNHLPTYLFIISFIQLYRGAAHLAGVAGVRISQQRLMTIFVLYLTFASLFVALFFGTGATNKSFVNGIPAFAVPHSVLLFSLIIPSLIGWFMGVMASVYIRAYATKVKGIIYKKMLRALVVGIFATTTFAMLVQLLVLNTNRLQHLGLNAVLLIVYTFLVAYAVGAIFIVRSATKLTLLEVVA